MSYPIHKLTGGGGTVVTRTEREFMGLDTGGCGVNRPWSRAADTLNLIWDGEALRRRPGCAPFLEVGQPIYGLFCYGNQLIVHAGELLISYFRYAPTSGTVLYDKMNCAYSNGVLRHQRVEERHCGDGTANGWERRIFEEEFLFLCDGQNYLFYDGETVRSCTDVNWGNAPGQSDYYYATVPHTTVAKLPAEGSGDVDPRGDNLLSQFRTESFYLDNTAVNSLMLNCPLNAINQRIPLELRVRDHSGAWRQVACVPSYRFQSEPSGTRLTADLNLSAGIALNLDEEDRVVGLGSGSAYLAADGMDNLTVTYGVQKDYPEALVGATAIGFYGPDGGNSVLFMGGSEKTPGIDHFSAPGDLLCFYETAWEQLGNRDTPITGYCPLKDGRLAVLKNDPRDSNVFFRSHRLVEVGSNLAGEPYQVDAYPSVAGASVDGCINSHTVGWAGNEPCFMAQSGIYTVKSVSDELINLNETVLRSRTVEPYFNNATFSDICAVNWKGLYLLFLKETVLVTDGRSDGEGGYRFMRWELPLPFQAVVATEDALYLGCYNGSIYRISEGAGEEFEAYWQTPALEENSGLAMIFHRLELLLTAPDNTEGTFTLLRNGSEYASRTFRLWKGVKGQWCPIATRFGRCNHLAVRLQFPDVPHYKLWGLRLIYRKGRRR